MPIRNKKRCNNLGIEESPQLRDESGPRRIWVPKDESSVRMFGSALLGMALCGVRLGSSGLGSGLGPSSVPIGSALVRLFGTLVGLGWQLNICIGAGLATLTN